MTAYYSVCVWHSDDELGDGHWHCRYPRVKLWTLRRVLRKLYGEGWGHVSIFVEKRDQHNLATLGG